MRHILEAALALGSGLAFGTVVVLVGVENAGGQLAVLVGSAVVCWVSSPVLAWLDVGTGHAAVQVHR